MMMSSQKDRIASGAPPQTYRCVRRVFLSFLTITALAGFQLENVARAAEPSQTEAPVANRVQALIPELEAYIASGMKGFDVPGVAIGIVADDRLVYAKGFGVRSKSSGMPVDTRTVFQIGSTTKAFLAATEAIMVDRGKLRWDDRVVDLDPDFQLKDPWVTREFRVFDLLAQRSGLPPNANDLLGELGINETELIRSLRYVEPVSSFRTTFAYTNVTHHLAGRIVARAAGTADWNTVLQQELLDPLGMKDSSYTAAAIEAATNHADGYRWSPDGTVEVPFTEVFPYDFGGPAGDINSTVEDMARWVRLQLGNGTFEGRRIVSSENLAFTHTPKVALSDKLFYALGWIIQQTPNGNIIWHNGSTRGFGSFVGIVPDKKVGVIVLTNEENVGFPDALGRWTLDRILDNPKTDHVENALKAARTQFETKTRVFAKPASPRPFPPLGPLAGNFTNPSFGKAVVSVEGDALAMEISTGAKLKIEPWDGDVFTAKLMPFGRFAAVVENLGTLPIGFVQFQIDQNAKLNVLRLSSAEYGQAYEFRREVAPDSATAQAAVWGDFAGLVDIGGDRKMYLECRGAGSPTVVLVSGTRGAHDDWTNLIDLSGAAGASKPSESAVFSQVSRFTRVCAYDRPGTARFDDTRTDSTPVRQPTTAQHGVADLHALLIAAKEPGPYVLVGHSWGGLIARVFASTYPDEVSGLVLVDPASEFLKRSLTPAQWATYIEATKKLIESNGLEAPDHERSLDLLETAPQVRAIPVVVLTSDKRFDFGAGGAETWPAWRTAQERLAKLLDAKHVGDTNSGHVIQMEQPQLVIDAIREVVEAVRSGRQQLPR